MIFNIRDLSGELANIDFSHAASVTTTSENIDGYTNGGIWYFSGSYTPTGKPTGSNNFGFLIVIKGSNNQRLTQIWIDTGNTSNGIYFRTNSLSPVSWTSWKKVITDDVTVPKQLSVTIESELPTGVSSVNSVVAVQTGRVVTVSLSLTRDSNSLTSYQVVATGLPTAKVRPMDGSTTIPFGQIAVSGTATGRPLLCSINSTGKLIVNRGDTAGDYLGTFTYLTDDYSNL